MKKPRKRASRAIALCGLAVLFLAGGSGCTIMRQKYGTPIPEPSQFQPQETHFREVMKELGPPSDLSRMNDGMVFLYERVFLRERQLGIDINFNGYPFLKFVYGRGHAIGETACMTFDGDGLLQSQSWEEWDRFLGDGMAVQTFVSVMPVTDSGGYDMDPATYDWGMNLANATLQENLNRGSSLENGQNGIQKKGPMYGAGQTSMELVPIE